MLKNETIDVEPDVARVSEGLRDTGYEFNTAIADIVDNSIAAGATVVGIVAAILDAMYCTAVPGRRDRGQPTL